MVGWRLPYGSSAAAARNVPLWRYLANEDAPRDLADGEVAGDVMPGKLAGDLARLGLV